MRKTKALIALLAPLAMLARADDGSEDSWQALRRFLSSSVDARETAGGVVLVQQHGQVLFYEGFGWNELETTPFDPHALVGIASLTKPMTATLIARLAEEGVLKLDVPIGAWLPEFAEIDVKGKLMPGPTLSQLLHLRPAEQ